MLAGCLLPSRRTDELAVALPRFSRIAIGAVAVLALTGTYQAWREVAPLPALWSTEYGQLLLAKIAGFLVLVGLGNLSRLAVRRRYLMPVAHALSTEDADTRWTGPKRTGCSAGCGCRSASRWPSRRWCWRSPRCWCRPRRPGRRTRSRSTRPCSSPPAAPPTLSLSPARTGANTVSVAVLDQAGAPVDARQVSLTAALPAEQIGPLPVPLNRTGTGRYETAAASLPRPGTWELVLRVQKSEFDRDVAQVDVPVT